MKYFILVLILVSAQCNAGFLAGYIVGSSGNNSNQPAHPVIEASANSVLCDIEENNKCEAFVGVKYSCSGHWRCPDVGYHVYPERQLLTFEQYVRYKSGDDKATVKDVIYFNIYHAIIEYNP